MQSRNKKKDLDRKDEVLFLCIILVTLIAFGVSTFYPQWYEEMKYTPMPDIAGIGHSVFDGKWNLFLFAEYCCTALFFLNMTVHLRDQGVFNDSRWKCFLELALLGFIAPMGVYHMLADFIGLPRIKYDVLVPTPTDLTIALPLTILVFGKKHAITVALLTIGLFDDFLGVGGLAVISFETIKWFPVVALCVPSIVGAAMARWQLKWRAPMAYFTLGLVCYCGAVLGHIHPSLGFVPVFLIAPLGSAKTVDKWIHVPSELLLMVFAFVCTGASVTSVGPETWVYLVSISLGKLMMGIYALIMLGKLGMKWNEIITVGLLCGAGFKVSNLLAINVFGKSELLPGIQVGCAASVVVAFVSGLGFWLLTEAVMKIPPPGIEKTYHRLGDSP